MTIDDVFGFYHFVNTDLILTILRCKERLSLILTDLYHHRRQQGIGNSSHKQATHKGNKETRFT